jgi:hypothetical protein
MSKVTEKRIASSVNLNEYAAIKTSRSRILSILAIINVLENLLNFFSPALYRRVTRVKVIPAKSNNKNGQNFVIRPVVKYETPIPAKAIIAVKINRLRINRFTNSFMTTAVRNLLNIIFKVKMKPLVRIIQEPCNNCYFFIRSFTAVYIAAPTDRMESRTVNTGNPILSH